MAPKGEEKRGKKNQFFTSFEFVELGDRVGLRKVAPTRFDRGWRWLDFLDFP